MRGKRLLLVLTVVGVLAVAADAPAGGIDDEACPNVAGEHTNTCPSGTVGVPYRLRFVEREGSGCGPGRQTFHLDSGEMPPGLSLALDGTLRGTPAQAGTFQFYVEMREPWNELNCAGKETQKQFTLRVRKPVSINSAPALAAPSEVGVPFRMALRARGGTGVFAWSIVLGKLPAGVRLHIDGSIAGTPRTAGTYGFTARARDTEFRLASRAGTFIVAPRLHIPTRRLPVAEVGRFYSADLVAAGGVVPRVWTLASGRLPRGVRLATALGRFTGTPKEAGTYRVAVDVRDGLGVTFTRVLTVFVRNPSPVLPKRR